MKIFLSYPSERRLQAEEVALALRSRSHIVFFDRDDLPAGETYHDQIVKAINVSHVVVFLISLESLEEGRYTHSEVNLTQRKWPNPNKRVLPVMLEPVPIQNLPPYLREVTILQPTGNLAAETAAAVDGFGWRGLSKRGAIVTSAATVLVVIVSILTLITFKKFYFDEWTWKGFIVSGQTLPCLLASVFPLAIWGSFAYSVGRGGSILGRLATSALDSRLSIGLLALLVAMVAGLAIGHATVSVTPKSQRLENMVADHSWDLAQRELDLLLDQPLPASVKDTYRLYLGSARLAARYEFPGENQLRQDRAAIRRLLSTGKDHRFLATIAFADNTRAISLQEDDPQIIEEALEVLAYAIAKDGDTEQLGTLHWKCSELYLARGDYGRCREEALKAIELLPEGPLRASAYGNIGNTFAAQGQFDKAIKYYHEAEEHYPEGYRFLFFSNYSFIYRLAGEYDNAVKMAKRAIKMKRDDWVSHLNLALIYEDMGRFEDARQSYSHVIDNAARSTDASCEARLLLGRNIEMDQGLNEAAVSSYLDALDRSTSSKAVSRILSSKSELYLLYNELGKAMRQINTHGIEEYIEWFEARAKSIRESNRETNKALKTKH